MRFRVILKAFFAVAFGFYALRGSFVSNSTWLIDGANILFHEAGHIFFSVLGDWMGMAGGTLLQLLFPLGLAVAFCLKKQNYSAGLMAIWFGENFSGISIYISDARSQALPLIGGERHDWFFILNSLSVLEYDQAIGSVVWFLGMAIVIAATVWSVCGVFKNKDENVSESILS